MTPPSQDFISPTGQRVMPPTEPPDDLTLSEQIARDEALLAELYCKRSWRRELEIKKAVERELNQRAGNANSGFIWSQP